MNSQQVSISDPPKTVLMFDKDASTHSIKDGPTTSYGRNVLYLDGTVLFLLEADFQQLIDPDDFFDEDEAE